MAAARILIADDFPALRKGVRAILEGRLGTEVCGEAGDGVEAVERAIALKPDLIVLDISMPNMDGFEAARRILAVSSDTPILLFSMNLTSGHVGEAKKIGCRGLRLKDGTPGIFASRDRGPAPRIYIFPRRWQRAEMTPWHAHHADPGRKNPTLKHLFVGSAKAPQRGVVESRFRLPDTVARRGAPCEGASRGNRKGPRG